MLPKTSFYLIGGFGIMVLIGAVLYVVVFKGTFPLGNQKPESTAQTILPEPIATPPKDMIPPQEPVPGKDPITASSTEQEVPVPPLPQEPEKLPEPPPIIPEEPEPQPQLHIVSIKNNGFEPKFIKITVGDTVRWVNNDNRLRWPGSDPHPTHTGLPGFDPFADLAPGESFEFTFIEVGDFTYHEHTQALVDDEATQTGAVRVFAVQ